MNKRIRISKTRFSPLINIEIDAFHADLAANLIDRLIKISNEMQVNIKTRQMGQKRQFIKERIEEIKSCPSERRKPFTIFSGAESATQYITIIVAGRI